jgi:hypothetical protein
MQPQTIITNDAHLKIVLKIGSSRNTKYPAVGCEYIHIKKNCRELTLYHTAGNCKQLRDHFIAANNRKPQWWSKAFIHIVCEIEHRDVVRTGIFVDEFLDKYPCKWMKLASMTLKEANKPIW